jgi:hypothetical protein
MKDKLTIILEDSIELENLRKTLARVVKGEIELPLEILERRRSEFNALMKKYFPDRKYLQVEKNVEEPEMMFV